MCLGVCVCLEGGEGVGGSKKKKNSLSLTPDDIFGSTSKASQEGRERERCTGDRSSAASPCSAPEENSCIAMVVCWMCTCVLGGWWCFFFFLHKQTGGL